MRDHSFELTPDLLQPAPPFAHGLDPANKFRWRVTDVEGRPVAKAKTRAGIRAAMRELYGRAA